LVVSPRASGIMHEIWSLKSRCAGTS
jgi:hypothetical protein